MKTRLHCNQLGCDLSCQYVLQWRDDGCARELSICSGRLHGQELKAINGDIGGGFSLPTSKHERTVVGDNGHTNSPAVFPERIKLLQKCSQEIRLIVGRVVLTITCIPIKLLVAQLLPIGHELCGFRGMLGQDITRFFKKRREKARHVLRCFGQVAVKVSQQKHVWNKMLHGDWVEAGSLRQPMLHNAAAHHSGAAGVAARPDNSRTGAVGNALLNGVNFVNGVNHYGSFVHLASPERIRSRAMFCSKFPAQTADDSNTIEAMEIVLNGDGTEELWCGLGNGSIQVRSTITHLVAYVW